MSKPTKWHARPVKTQISLGIRPVCSESLLSAWRKLGSLATHWVHSEDSDQSLRMARLIWCFPGHTVILLVLSWGGSFYTIAFSLLLSVYYSLSKTEETNWKNIVTENDNKIWCCSWNAASKTHNLLNTYIYIFIAIALNVAVHFPMKNIYQSCDLCRAMRRSNVNISQ